MSVPGADLDEHVGHGRRACVSRIDVHQHGPALLGQHRPVKADRVRLRHVRTHDENTIAVGQVAWMVRGGAEASEVPRPGTDELCQRRAWFSMGRMPRPPVKSFLIR